MATPRKSNKKAASKKASKSNLIFPVGRIGRLRAVPGLRGRILGIRLRLPRRVRGGFPRHRRSPARA